MLRPRLVQLQLYVVVAACGAWLIPHTETAAAEILPYEARVVATGASVHSGPGEKYYPTDTLAQGDLVEVYREKPGGWLAIRPPANSFSWVAAGDLKLKDGGLAEINKDDVASRIGSRLNDKHNAAQVRLKKGEVVEVLDEQRIGDETWYKIAPPAGEFRWIQASLVERTGPVQRVSSETTMREGGTRESKTDGASTSGNSVSPPPLISNPPSSSATATLTTPPAAQSAAAPPAPAASEPRAAGPVADDLSRELSAIELRLSRMVAAPVNLWNTERLERDVAQLLNRSQTPAERDAVQVTLNKINQFAMIGHRANQLPANVAQNGQPPITPLPGGPAIPTAATAAATPPSPGNAGPYDAVGILRPVVSRRPGAPQFALVDDRGQVLSFITPTPDMNLQPYLGRRVGVVGSRGYIAEFNRAHVTAARVTPLSDRVLR
jgi:hypothetical protein